MDLLQYYDETTKILTIPWDFNEELNNIPKTCEEIIFNDFNGNIYEGNNFNQEIREKVLPLNLTHLTFGYVFNQEIKEKVLPLNLTHLTFRSCFNQKIKENVLPLNLTHLTFGSCFNQKIKEKVLPLNLTHLIFGFCFNQEIKENILPLNLTHLIFKSGYNKKINYKILPKSLKYIEIYNNIFDKYTNKIYFTIYNYKINIIDKNIENVIIQYDCESKKSINNLPINLRKIFIDKEINQKIEIPFGCKVFYFETCEDIYNTIKKN